ncbi:Bcr/CflA family drug resistance efflux transporter [Pseudomonas alcaligenes]|uniref:Bcr/CflA family efflux transporter n=1 Tax=Aquipseudomonas alcaligenes TaxID=43263 RepID=A0ABR7RYI9_AQUAC|nr:multidrug effflux MFS transporter [Pseudomonas alcaligenes]MBC9249542.1 Bcr/CflA family drug resistance efflux transporter [Pseudomonas alcaligenes]
MKLRILLILGWLSAFGPMAIDFYLPTFPSLATFFATDVEHIQLSLASYFAGIAIGQLAYGPMADRFGRRVPLLVGVVLFTLASLACALAQSLEWLIVARFVQALGGCAGMVISRAVVRDLCDPLQSAKVFSKLMLVMGVAPILAPMGGGILLQLFGWQAVFHGLMLFSALCLLAVLLWLPETLSAQGPRPPLSGALKRYLQLLRDPLLIGYGLTGGVAMAGMFAYIAGSPFVFIELYGVSPQHYGWLFGANAAGFILTAQLNGWLLRRHGPAYWLPRTVWVYLLAALVFLLVCLTQPQSLWPLLPPLFISIASLSCILPNATACAMAGQGAQAGSASALIGSLQFCVAAGATALVGALHDGTARPVALVIFGCATLTVLLALLTTRKARQGALEF